jgi:hypothetical protein
MLLTEIAENGRPASLRCPCAASSADMPRNESRLPLRRPDSWPLQSDREEARRARANAEHAEQLRQRLRGAVLRAG